MALVGFKECMSSLERVSEDLYMCLSRCTPVHDAEVARETRVLYIGKRLLLDGDV